MKCIIVDDEEMSRNALKHLVGQVDYLNLLKVCNGSVEAIETLKKEKVDLMFLDIEMPGMSGIELLKCLESTPLVILTTSHTEYALDAFEYNVVDYLIKPLQLPRFIKAANKANEIFENSKTNIDSLEDKEYFFIRYNSVLTKIFAKDILWIEASGDYLTINTINQKFLLHLTLKAIESKLPPNKFIRVHRSYIVAIDNITSIEDTIISISNKLIPVGALYRESFMKRLNLL
jgi:DNA-binding LytR/AlgR family response regulator